MQFERSFLSDFIKLYFDYLNTIPVEGETARCSTFLFFVCLFDFISFICLFSFGSFGFFVIDYLVFFVNALYDHLPIFSISAGFIITDRLFHSSNTALINIKVVCYFKQI